MTLDIHAPLTLLGGLSAHTFMTEYWHKKPLLIRGAMPSFVPPVDKAGVFELAASESVESRLIQRMDQAPGWTMKHGPLGKRHMPALKQPGWTVLVQGVDLYVDAVHDLARQFRFIPDARLDDVMISYASDGGGVGPHFDSYDVFLLQATGTRRWSIGQQTDLTLQDGVPLKILTQFQAEDTWDLTPGDMLYLPPKWAHDGVAVGGDCITYSIGFRSPQRAGLAAELLQRMAEHWEDDAIYTDADQPATTQPGAVPTGLMRFARSAMADLLADDVALQCALGEVMTEPKPKVWFDEPVGEFERGAVVLDRRTRMMYDAHHVFINGEALNAEGPDAELMHRLADERCLPAEAVLSASDDAHAVLHDWFEAGWLHCG